MRVSTEPHPADWRRHGNAAGPIRNAEMIASGVDFCVAVHRNLARSRGTLDCVRRCWEVGIPVYLVESNDVQVRRIRGMEDLLPQESPA
jgi:hypothetical protein